MHTTDKIANIHFVFSIEVYLWLFINGTSLSERRSSKTARQPQKMSIEWDCIHIIKS